MGADLQGKNLNAYFKISECCSCSSKYFEHLACRANMKMQCENKRRGLKSAAKETSSAVIHVYSFWVDFPKPLGEREPDCLHILLLRIWQPHVLRPGAFCRVPSSWPAAPTMARQHTGLPRNTWHRSSHGLLVPVRSEN